MKGTLVTLTLQEVFNLLQWADCAKHHSSLWNKVDDALKGRLESEIPSLINKLGTEDIAFRLNESGYRSDSSNIEDLITESLLEQINPFLVAQTEQVIQEMQELEHPEPRTREEYNERYGLGEGE